MNLLNNDMLRFQKLKYAQSALLDVGAAEAAAVVTVEVQPWPKELAKQAQAIRQMLGAAEGPLSAEDVAGLFTGRRTSKRVAQVLELLRCWWRWGKRPWLRSAGMWGCKGTTYNKSVYSIKESKLKILL